MLTLARAKEGTAFVIAELCARLREEGEDAVRKEVRAWFEDEVLREIEESNGKGNKVLLENVRAL